MLFLLGVRAHPAIRMLIGAVAIAVGLILGFTVLAAGGAAMLIWGGYTWLHRSRAAARQEAARLHKSGATR